MMKGKDFLTLANCSTQEVRELLDLAAQMKAGTANRLLAGNYGAPPVLGLLFYKASTRTRVSFSTAIYQLGGQVLDLNTNVTQVSRGEPVADTARVLSRYLNVLAVRTYEQQELEEFARYADIPVINALSDLYHPCQALADLMTVRECFGRLQGITLTYLGDGNNVAHSLLLGCALAGVNIRIATPEKFAPQADIVTKAKNLAAIAGTEITITTDPKIAAENANVLYTDVWTSMGAESQAEQRIPTFQAYQLNQDLLSLADPDAIVLHCLPAHRGEEITEEVLEGEQSRVWDQAENRMHAQKALLASIFT